MPKITVIIPTFNRELFVMRAIDSVLNQSFKDYEIVVVDDGSTDNTQSTVRRFGSKIRYIYQKNAGVSAARNTGIEAAACEWVAFLDSDDEWATEYLSWQMERADGDSQICMQATDCCFTGLSGRTNSFFALNGILSEFRDRDYLVLKEPFSFIVQNRPWQIGSTIIRRGAIEKAGRFDVSLKISEDFDFMARVALHGSFAMIRKMLVNVYRRDEPLKCLTRQAVDDPVQARKSEDRMYGKLKQIEGLKRKERRAVNKMMSANQRALGNLLLERGMIESAGDYYRRSLVGYPSMRSLGRYFWFHFLTRYSSAGQTSE